MTIPSIQHPTFDLLIKGGTVIDGSKRPRFKADVGIVKDDRSDSTQLRTPSTRRLGSVGHPADVVVFDANAICDLADYQSPTEPA